MGRRKCFWLALAVSARGRAVDAAITLPTPQLVRRHVLGQEDKVGTLVLVRHGDTEWDQSMAFTGWADPDISENGRRQAYDAALALKESGYRFDVAYTSVLKRSIHTTWVLLKELDLIHLPVWKHWRLNERNYGAATGFTLQQMKKVYGAQTVASWRRSTDAQPPPFPANHPYRPDGDRKYQRWQDRNGKLQPVTGTHGERMSDCIARVLPVWEQEIASDLADGRSVLVVAHGDSIRGILQAIDGIPDADIGEIEVPPCVPLVYKFERCDQSRPLCPGLEAVRQQNAIGFMRGEFLAAEQALQEALDRARQESLMRYGLIDLPSDRRCDGVLPGLEGNAGEECELDEYGRFVYKDREAPIKEPTVDANTLQERQLMSLEPLKLSFELPSYTRAEGQQIVIIRHGKTEHNKLGLFTGWEDAGLAPEGRKEATSAGKMLAKAGIHFDVVYTSWLSRAIETAWLVLDELDDLWLPIHKSWRLNERMYGALTGLSKKKTQSQYGKQQFMRWRRGYDTRPPTVSSFSQFYPGNDQRYVLNIRDVRVSIKETLIRSLERGKLTVHRKLPRTESLKDCMERTIPYWVNSIERNAIARGKNVLIASSENAIRGLLMHLFEIPPERISEIEIPTGLPLIYDAGMNTLCLLDENGGREGDHRKYNFGKGGGELLFGDAPSLLDAQASVKV